MPASVPIHAIALMKVNLVELPAESNPTPPLHQFSFDDLPDHSELLAADTHAWFKQIEVVNDRERDYCTLSVTVENEKIPLIPQDGLLVFSDFSVRPLVGFTDDQMIAIYRALSAPTV